MDLSESVTSSITDSTEFFSMSSNRDSEEPNQMLEDIFQPLNKEKRKRGRRPLRPQDPIRKKTEEKDKYWLRAFRSHMSGNFEKLKPQMSPDEIEFWDFYLSHLGKPGKGHKFLSYGKQYKKFLFTTDTFMKYFRKWFDQHGEELLAKKYEPGSDKWFVFFDYAARDLYYFNGQKVESNKPSSPLICVNQEAMPACDELMLDGSSDFINPVL